MLASVYNKKICNRLPSREAVAPSLLPNKRKKTSFQRSFCFVLIPRKVTSILGLALIISLGLGNVPVALQQTINSYKITGDRSTDRRADSLERLTSNFPMTIKGKQRGKKKPKGFGARASASGTYQVSELPGGRERGKDCLGKGKNNICTNWYNNIRLGMIDWKPLHILMPKEMLKKLRKKARELKIPMAELVRRMIKGELGQMIVRGCIEGCLLTGS